MAVVKHGLDINDDTASCSLVRNCGYVGENTTDILIGEHVHVLSFLAD